MGFDLRIGATQIKLIGEPPTDGKKKKEGHVRWLPPSMLFCMHCADRYVMNLPASTTIVVAVMKAFSKDHRQCKKVRGVACCHCFEFGHKMSECPRLSYDGDPQRWREGPDTGTSSICIWEKLHNGFNSSTERAPRDPDDFGRCYRLLKSFAGWRERIGELTDVAEWRPLVEAWNELEKLYEEELPSGTCPKLYARMKELQGGIT